MALTKPTNLCLMICACVGALLPACGGEGSNAHPAVGGIAGADNGSAGDSATSGAGNAVAGAATSAAGAGASGIAGASSSSAGSGGAEPATPHVVGKCDALGAMGTWQNVTPPEFRVMSNLETTCVAVNPADQSVYAAASNVTNGGKGGTGLYKSTDCGSTWKKVSVTPNLETGSCFSLTIDSVNTNNMYYANGYGDNPTLWKSTDGGVNWLPLNTDANHVLQYGFVDKVAMEPKDPQHLIVTYHEVCKDPLGPQCMAETTNGGASWRQFKGPDTGFAEGNRVGMLGKTNWVYLSNNGGWFTNDSGQTWEKVICWGAGTDTCTSVGGPPADVWVGSEQLFGGTAQAFMAVLTSGVLQSKADTNVPLGRVWKLIPNSPSSANVASDGVNLYASGDYTDQPYSTATLAAPTVWSPMRTDKVGRRADRFSYDADHHVMYSANLGGGVWRLLTH